MSPRWVGELAALLVAVAIFGYLGWDGALWDPRLQAVLHLAAVAGVGGLAWIALAGGSLPRTVLDRRIALLLLAFAVATLSGWNLGLSAHALAAILGTTAMLPVALLAIRHRPGWTAMAVTLPVLALAAGSLVMLAWRRVEWIAVGGPGLPPARMANEGTPFGAVAVPPFVLLAILPLLLLVPWRRVRVSLLVAVGVIGIPLTVLSGSRSAWLAMAVTAVVMAGPWLAARSGLRKVRTWMTRGRIAAAGLALALGITALALIGSRITDVSSLIYRGYLWRDTLAAWSTNPLLGVGPGAMPYARQAFAPALSFPVRQPHSHDIILGLLGDAGVIGLAAGILLFGAFVVACGPWRTRTVAGRLAFAVLSGIAVSFLFEDLTFLPGFNLLVLLLVAIALTDAGAVRWGPMALRMPARVAAGAAVAAVLAVVVLGDAAAIAYRAGTDAAGDGRWPEATAWLRRASALDPWQPTTPKALTITADRAGDGALALAAAQGAVRLSPGDGSSWTNLAVLCADAGNTGCARHAADRAVAAATANGSELVNAAIVYEILGDRGAADHAYRLSLLTNLWTSLALHWQRPVAIGTGTADELRQDTAELNLLIGRRTSGEEISPDRYHSDAARALAAAMAGDWGLADESIRAAMRSAPDEPVTWELAALLARQRGRDADRFVRIGDVVRGSPAPDKGTRMPTLIFDIATFRAYPADGLVTDAARLLTGTPWPWVLEPLLPTTPAAGAG